MPYYVSAIRRSPPDNAHADPGGPDSITHLSVDLDLEGTDAQPMAVIDAVRAIHFQGQEWYTAVWKKGVAFEGSRVHAHLGDRIHNPHVYTDPDDLAADRLDALPSF